MVKENTYVTIQAFMVNELHLKGNELLIYAIIWGFSQDGESEFTGSLQYLADWCNTSKQTVLTALQSLCEKKLILKNVEYKNNLRFCTYKTSMVYKNFEQGSQNYLMGYTKNLNGGSQNSLTNNINNKLDNKLENTQEEIVPAYIPQPLKITPTDFQTLLNNCFSMITEHNRSAVHKIPISKAILYFTQKEGRQISQLLQQYDGFEITDALGNYLKTANMKTWKTSFSFNAFCNSISEYLPEYFDISKYVTIPKSEEEIKAMTESFAQEHEYEKWFDYAVFHHNRAEWLKAGKPEGDAFKKWAEERLAEDEKNGRLDKNGLYI